MIEAYFNERGNVVLKATIRGLYKSKRIELLIDSGFSADLCLDLKTACTIGLESQGVASVRLADGSITTVSVFIGAIDLDELTPRECSIFVIPQISESLIGMGLLSFYEVCFHGAKNMVSIKSLSVETPIKSLSETLRSIIPR